MLAPSCKLCFQLKHSGRWQGRSQAGTALKDVVLLMLLAVHALTTVILFLQQVCLWLAASPRWIGFTSSWIRHD